VSIARLVDVVRARRKFRRAAFYRKRARRRSLQNNPSAKKFRYQREPLFSGHGELHALLKSVGLSEAAFCELIGMDRTVFHRWYGFPLHSWPSEFLRHYGWAQNMARQLREWGRDPTSYMPQFPSKAKSGSYPRTSAQTEELLRNVPAGPRFRP
jgi:hypothetical protein